ncbi:MAG: hypothetical protein ACTSRZ_11670 [Promethearchaeota archaeon]
MAINTIPIKCPECGSPFDISQIEKIKQGLIVICMICGYEYDPNKEKLKDVMPSKGEEPPNLFPPPNHFNSKPPPVPPPLHPINPFARRPIRPIRRPINRPPPPLEFPDTHPKINTKNILKHLPKDWVTLRQLASKLNIFDPNEFYILRMKLNEMKEKNLIEMIFKINRVLIKKI